MKKKKVKKVEELEATPEDILYGDKPELLYKVLYNEEEEYTFDMYLKDNMLGGHKLNKYRRLETISGNSNSPKITIMIVYKKEDKRFSRYYPFDKIGDADAFIKWCDENWITHAIP